MIFITNSLGAVILLTTAARGGELSLLHERLHTHPTAILWLLSTVVLAYGGSYAFTACIKGFGAVVATGVGICRKFVSVMASYSIFPKPTNVQHAFGILLFFAGMVLSWSQQASFASKPNKPKRTSSSQMQRRRHGREADDSASSADVDSDENLDSPTSSDLVSTPHGTPGTPTPFNTKMRRAHARWGVGEQGGMGRGDEVVGLAHAAAVVAWSKGQKSETRACTNKCDVSRSEDALLCSSGHGFPAPTGPC